MAVLALMFCGGPSLAVAQPKPAYSVSSTHVFPAGGRRGTTIELRVGAECLPPHSNFIMFGDGVKARRELSTRLSSTGEPSPRRAPTETPITYPKEWQSQVTIAADAPLGPAFWRVSCASGGTGSRPFIIGDLPEFIERESNSTLSRAEQIKLPVTINGRIHGERDVDYFRFQLDAGQTVIVDVIAQRLGSRLDPIVELLDPNETAVNARLTHIGNDPQLQFTASAGGDFILRVANVTLHGSPAHVYRINLTFDRANNARNAAVLNEREPNDDQAKSVALSLPETVRGCFANANDEDWFQFEAKKDERFRIECESFPRGTVALPCLQVFQEKTKPLASAKAIDSTDRRCVLDWKAPAAGTYWLRVRDLRYGVRGGSNFKYQLDVAAAKGDFTVTLSSDCVNLVPGGKSSVDVVVDRRGGFDGPIDVSVEALPAGLKLETKQIAAKASSAKLEFSCDDTVAPSDVMVQVICYATVEGTKLKRIAKAKHLGIDGEGISIGPSLLTRLNLTVQYKPAFRLFCAEAYQYAHRGTVYPYLMEIERLDGFGQPITLQIGDRQNRDLDGIEMREVTIGADQSKVMLPIYLPETMHINVQSQSQLYSQAFATFIDKAGRKQSVLVLSEKRNMLRTLPPVVKLNCDETHHGKPGQEVTVRFTLQRTSNFLGPMTLELVEPQPGFTASNVTIPAGTTEAMVTVRLPSRLSNGSIPLIFRATGNLTEDTLVITEATCRLMVED